MKLELLTNATVVNDAMRFVSDYDNNKRLISKQDENKESKESDYDDKDTELEGAKQETKEIVTGETTTIPTINQVF